MKTVNDMYKAASTSSRKLLSDYPSDFWSDYRTNYTKYDKLFNRMFYSFYYFMQSPEENASEIMANFVEDVYNHLLINDKKYTELYRVQTIPDTNYSLTDNYDMYEEMDKDVTDNQDNVYGQRTDTGEFVSGSRTDTGELVSGSRTDTGEYVSGSRTDSGETVYGERTDSGETVKGERTDNSTNNTGTQTNTSTDSVAPYDSSTFANHTKKVDELGAREDTIEFVEGQQTDTTENTKGQQTDTTENTKGQQTDTTEDVKGQQTDTTENVKGQQTDTSENVKGSQTDNLDRTYTEDYTLHRHGNIGVQTVSDMLSKHIKLWSMWEFYEYIFKEISKELLML